MSELLEEIKRDALEAQRFSRKHMVLELDFSPTSIAELEAEADTVEYAITGGKSAENIALLARIWGAYLGESIRRATGGEWVREEDDRVGLRTGGTTLYPQEQVEQRLCAGAAFNLSEYFQRSTAAS